MKADGVQVNDAVTTTSQNTLSSAAANFASTDVGKTVALFAQCATDGATPTTVDLVGSGTTIATVVDAHNITLSGNVTTGGSGQCFEYGTDNETPATAIDTYLSGLPAGAKCPHIVLPAGDMFVDSPHWVVQPTPCQNNPDVLGGTVQGGGLEISGQGSATTRIIESPKFWAQLAAGTICKNGGSFAPHFNCWFLPPNAYFHDFQITGLGESRTGASDPANTIMVGLGSYSVLDHFHCNQAGWNDGALVYGFYAFPALGAGSLGGEVYLHFVDFDGCGSTIGNNGVGGSFQGTLFADHSTFQDSNGSGVTCASSAGINYIGDSNLYLSRNSSTSGFINLFNNGGTCRDKHGTFYSQTNQGGGTNAATTMIKGAAGSATYIEGANVGGGDSQSGGICFNIASTGVLHLSNTVASCGVSGAGTFSNSGVIYNHCGNTIPSSPGTLGVLYSNGLCGDANLAVTFANLGTPVNGTGTYCSDCTVANPCAGSGNGAYAKRLNGAWVCN